jgi:phosphate transport system permease protein
MQTDVVKNHLRNGKENSGEYKESSRWLERLITFIIFITGYSAIIFVGLILFFLVREGFPALLEVPIKDLFSLRWYPIESLYGVLPLLGGSLVVTIGAAMIAIPMGIGTAVYIAEIAPRWAREILKPFIEVLAGVPSVVLGFIGILVIAPYVRRLFGIPTGLSAIAGSLILGSIAIPTIVSVAEDALDNVPRAYRDASVAMGATEWQTIWRVTFPAARSGVLMAIMLGIGRIIGETIIVMMVTGNAPVFPTSLLALFHPVRTVTATIAAEMGEVAKDSIHYHVLFFLGIILFFISLIVNLIATSVVFRKKMRSERILS